MYTLTGRCLEPVRAAPVWLCCYTIAWVQLCSSRQMWPRRHICVESTRLNYLPFTKTYTTLSSFEKLRATSSKWCARCTQRVGQETSAIIAIITDPEPDRLQGLSAERSALISSSIAASFFKYQRKMLCVGSITTRLPPLTSPFFS